MGKIEDIKLNVYNDKDEVIKTVSANPISLRFGQVRSLMELLKVENIDSTFELMSTVYSAWSELIVILSRVFTDMEYEDWDNVKLEELIPILTVILKDTFLNLLKIPVDSKKK